MTTISPAATDTEVQSPRWPDPFEMPGEKNADAYHVIKATKLGRLGFQLLPDGTAQVRVEPSRQEYIRLLAPHFWSAPWSQPDENRPEHPCFSCVFTDLAEAQTAIVKLLRALGDDQKQWNTALRRWRQRLSAHAANP